MDKSDVSNVTLNTKVIHRSGGAAVKSPLFARVFRALPIKVLYSQWFYDPSPATKSAKNIPQRM